MLIGILFQFKPDVEATELALAFPLPVDLSEVPLAKVSTNLACKHLVQLFIKSQNVQLLNNLTIM